MSKDEFQPESPTSDTPQFDQLILKPMIDPKSGFFLLMCSEDNGATWIPEFSSQGKLYHQRDIDRISEVPFKHILMKSPNGTAFYLSVNDEGEPVFTPVEKGDES